MATSKVQTGSRFDEDIIKKIQYLSKFSRRSMNSQIEFMVEEYIRQYEKQNGEIIISEEE